MKKALLFFVFLAVIGCRQAPKKLIPPDNYKTRIYQTDLNQFGYDIYKDSTLIVHQPTIPVIQGNQAFSSRDDAQRVADLMIYKLNNHVSPPSITINELDSLKIKK